MFIFEHVLSPLTKCLLHRNIVLLGLQCFGQDTFLGSICSFLKIVLNKTVFAQKSLFAQHTVPVLHNHETQVVSSRHVKQIVGFCFRPVFVVQVLLVFDVGVSRDVDLFIKAREWIFLALVRLSSPVMKNSVVLEIKFTVSKTSFKTNHKIAPFWPD